VSEDFARFLADRYDEAETDERALAEWAPGRELFVGTENYGEATPFRDYDPAHRLADIKLKRAILAEHVPEANDGGGAVCDRCADWTEETRQDVDRRMSWPCTTLRQLGTEFAEHPAYKEGWKP
jgi:hypothetical protein